MMRLLKRTIRYASKHIGFARYRMRDAFGWTAAGESPVRLLAAHLSDRYLKVIDCLWRLGDSGPLRVVVPESIRGPLEELTRRTGRRNPTWLSFDALAMDPEPRFGAIVLMGELIQRMPAPIARRILNDWRIVQVSDPLSVFVDPMRSLPPLPQTPASTDADKAREGLKYVLNELEQLAAAGLIVPAPFGAKLRCRYSIFDLEAVREAKREYFDQLAVKPGDVIVDIGAHLGGFSVPCGMQSSSDAGGKVIAYEPCPANFALLSENIARNCPGKVNAIPMAIFKHRCKLMLQLDPNHSTGHGLFGARTSNRATEVECVGLSDVIAHAGGTIDVLKLDAEGAEYDFLFGHADLLRNSVRTIIAEAHVHEKLSGDDLAAFLKEAGYQVKAHGPRNSMIILAQR
jgi:FkbM family methyltransferase